MLERVLTSEGLAAWIIPREALRLLSSAFGPASARQIIFQGLRGGIIRAISGSSSWSDAYNGPTLRPSVWIPGKYWDGLADRVIPESFWTTGAVRLLIESDARRAAPREVSFFDVRFEPDAINAVLLGAVTGPERLHAHRGPPVPDPLLRKWFELFLRAYEGAEISEARALESANGMFPQRSVSRDRVRKLLADRRAAEAAPE